MLSSERPPWTREGALSLLATIATLGAAASVATGVSKVVVHNGLGVPVVVICGSETFHVSPGRSHWTFMPPDEGLQLATTTAAGKPVEALVVDASTPGATYLYNVAGANQLYREDSCGAEGSLGAPRWRRSVEDETLGWPSSGSWGEPQTRVSAERQHFAVYYSGRIPDREERLRLVIAHARFDPTERFGTRENFKLLAKLGGDPAAILFERLVDEPTDILLHEIAQQYGGPEVCEGDRQLAGERPDDPDLAYLAARCAPEAERPAAFAAALARFPDQLNLAREGGVQAAIEQRWSDAEILALRAGPLLGDLGWYYEPGLARVRRAQGKGVEEQLEGLDAQRRERAGRALFGERDGARPEAMTAEMIPADRASTFISAGRLDEAAREAEQFPFGPGEYAWWIAASDGASPLQRLAVRQRVPDESMFRLYPAIVLGVARRDGGLTPELLAAAQDGNPSFLARIRPALDAGTRAELRAAIDRAVVGTEPKDRGMVRLTGVLLAREWAPEEWRREAKTLLLPHERPYLR